MNRFTLASLDLQIYTTKLMMLNICSKLPCVPECHTGPKHVPHGPQMRCNMGANKVAHGPEQVATRAYTRCHTDPYKVPHGHQ